MIHRYINYPYYEILPHLLVRRSVYNLTHTYGSDMKGVFSKLSSAVCLRSTFNKLKESVYHNDILVSHGVWHFFIRKIDNFHTTLMSWLSIMKRQIFGKHLVWKRFPFSEMIIFFLKVEQNYDWTCRYLSTEAMSFCGI